MPRKKKDKSHWDLEPQKASAAQFLTYVASTGTSSEKYEIRYEDENIWMSQKMLAAVYGVAIPNIAYHLRKLFEDAGLDKNTSIKEVLTDVGDGRKFVVNHYNLQVIIALGFKIDNERAGLFRKWTNQIVGEYTIKESGKSVPMVSWKTDAGEWLCHNERSAAQPRRGEQRHFALRQRRRELSFDGDRLPKDKR